MSEFDDKLGAILGNPEAMSQIMALAQSLGGSPGAPAQPSSSPSPPPASPAVQAPAEGTDPSALFGMLGDLDPALIQAGTRLLSELSRQDDARAALLLALRPFLNPDRRAKLDRAAQIARLSRVLRVAFRLFKGKGDANV